MEEYKSQAGGLDEICKEMNQLDLTSRPTVESGFAFLPNEDGDTDLHLAIIEQDEKTAIYLINIAQSYDWLNAKNNMLQTPLHLAVLTNQLTVARRLVVGGACLTQQDGNGNTPLHLAARNGLVMMAHVLTSPVRYIETKENGYDIPYQSVTHSMSIYNFEGLTCAHVASMNGHMQMLKLFIQCGAKMNSIELKHGKTNLHIACANHDEQMVNFLCSFDSCDTGAKTYDGYTPFDLFDDTRMGSC